MQAAVTGEVYRVTADGFESDSAAIAIAHAYVMLATEIVAGGVWTRSTIIQRVTRHEPVHHAFGDPTTETVIGEICVQSPGELAGTAEMARMLPAAITVEP